MAWYRIGTVTVTSGGASVVGAGTAWIDNVQDNHGFVGPDGNLYEVLSVNSDTSITLATNYAGASASGASYATFPTQGLVAALAKQVAQLLADYSGVLTGAGAGKFGNGSAAAPGISFAADVDTGFYRFGANSFAWSAGGAFQGLVDASGRMLLNRSTDSGLGHLQVSSPNGAIADLATPATESSLVRIRNAGAQITGLAVQNSNTGTSGIQGFQFLINVAGDAFVLQRSNNPIYFSVNDTVRVILNPDGSLVQSAPSAPPALGTNGTLVLNLTSNTNLRITARGTDGVTRVANIALA